LEWSLVDVRLVGLRPGSGTLQGNAVLQRNCISFQGAVATPAGLTPDQPCPNASTRAVRARAGSESSRARTASAGAATPRCKGGMRPAGSAAVPDGTTPSGAYPECRGGMWLAGSAAGNNAVSNIMPANSTVGRPTVTPPA